MKQLVISNLQFGLTCLQFARALELCGPTYRQFDPWLFNAARFGRFYINPTLSAKVLLPDRYRH
jgi:hypothetical protein